MGRMVLIAAVALMGVVQAADTFVADRCVFLHGLGVKGATDLLFMDVVYWKDLKPVASKLCKETHYPHFDTVSMGSNNKTLQDEFYNYAAQYQEDGDRVFAHSMGNLVLARACLDQGKCLSRGWFAASGPMLGSHLANDLYDWCPPRGTWPTALLTFVAELAGYCSVGTDSMCECDKAWSGGVCGSATMTQAEELVRVGSMVRHGTMCGTSGLGIASVLSPALGALDTLFMQTAGQGRNDGMVSFSSCSAAIHALATNVSDAPAYPLVFATTPESRYYTAEINHGDGMAFAGDSVFGDDAKKPLTWFSSMIKQGWLPAR